MQAVEFSNHVLVANPALLNSGEVCSPRSPQAFAPCPVHVSRINENQVATGSNAASGQLCWILCLAKCTSLQLILNYESKVSSKYIKNSLVKIKVKIFKLWESIGKCIPYIIFYNLSVTLTETSIYSQMLK